MGVIESSCGFYKQKLCGDFYRGENTHAVILTGGGVDFTGRVCLWR